MRLTADGRFHLCLLNDDEVDVRATLRRGGSRDEVAAILLRAIAYKPAGHRLGQLVADGVDAALGTEYCASPSGAFLH
jgi:molybdenum cofactor biosynthesis enzyme MoaA